MDIQKRLFALQDTTFREFNAKLIPNICADTVIGVRTPLIKGLAKEMYKSGEYRAFTENLPHRYFEENQLHAFIISQIADFDTAVCELERFLPYVDNWATCDQLVMKAIAKQPERMLGKIDIWIASGQTYTVRFAGGLLMRYFLDERFDAVYPEKVSHIETCDYYVNMMIAWYFATALAKQYGEILPFFTEGRLSVWVHNKSIQKAKESFRVSEENKAQLMKLVRSSKQITVP